MMTTNDDSRPFVQLKEDASKFSLKFDKDIKKCITFLDEQITSLICDPDSLSNSFGRVSLNAQMEFSKAKYDVFIKVRSLFTEIEEDWLQRIAQMKNTFLENVEIFLGETKLELPAEEMPARGAGKKLVGRNKSLKGQDESSSLSSSIYPIISSFTKTLSAIPSPLLRRSSHDDEAEDASDSFSRSNRRLAMPNTSPKKTGISSPYTGIYENPDNLPLRSRRSGLANVSSNRASLSSVHYNVLDTSNERFDEVPQESSESSSSSKEEEPIAENTLLRHQSEGTVIPRQGAMLNSGSRKRNITHSSLKISVEIGDDGSEEGGGESSPKKTFKGRGRTPAKRNLVASEIKLTPASNSRISRSRTMGKVETNQPEIKLTPASNSRISKSRTMGKLETNQPEIISAATLTPRGKGRRKTIGKAGNIQSDETNESDSTVENEEKVLLKTPKKVAFADNDDHVEELDLFSPDEILTKSAPRRRTMFKLQDEFSELNLIPEKSAKVNSKRKTIAGLSNLPDVSSPKRLKGRKSISSSFSVGKEDTKDNLLESDDTSGADGYTEWMSLKTIDKIPQLPGIYELKVWRAKKTAFIGSCENLRQKLTLHKLVQNSGHKHLDKFIERNLGDIQIRYDVSPSFSDAKQIVKDRVNDFVALYKTTPAYN